MLTYALEIYASVPKDTKLTREIKHASEVRNNYEFFFFFVFLAFVRIHFFIQLRALAGKLVGELMPSDMVISVT
jgi:hypothetical protein